MMVNTFTNRVLGKSLFGAAMLACALWGALGEAPADPHGAARAAAGVQSVSALSRPAPV